jgi:hypothetical protein
LSCVFLLIGVASEMIFFFEKEKIFTAQEISSGEAGDTSSNDDDVGLSRGVGTIESMAIPDLVADFEVFAVNERRSTARRWTRLCDKRGVDGAARRDGSNHNKLDEITA